MDMSKPYDGSALVSALKQDGIAEADVICKKVVSHIADWLRSSMQMSKDGIIGHLDDLAIPVIDSFEKLALAKLDALAAEIQAAPAAAVTPVSPAPTSDAPAPAQPASPEPAAPVAPAQTPSS